MRWGCLQKGFEMKPLFVAFFVLGALGAAILGCVILRAGGRAPDLRMDSYVFAAFEFFVALGFLTMAAVIGEHG